MVATSVILILTRGGKVLLQLRDDDPAIQNPFRWAIPSGGIEPGESPEDAAHRELDEEFPGLKVDLNYMGTTAMGTAIFHGAINPCQCFPQMQEGCAWGMFKPSAIRKLHDIANEVPAGLGGVVARRFKSEENFNALCLLINYGTPLPEFVFR